MKYLCAIANWLKSHLLAGQEDALVLVAVGADHEVSDLGISFVPMRIDFVIILLHTFLYCNSIIQLNKGNVYY